MAWRFRVLRGLLLLHPLLVDAQSATSTSYRPLFTVPASADIGPSVIPNIIDPQAVDPQLVCPGYQASNLETTAYGLTATLSLAGKACNVYGTDVDTLNLTVEYQTADRLHVAIVPSAISSSNSSNYILSTQDVPAPAFNGSGAVGDLTFAWSNTPTFGFSVTRNATRDVLFSTNGTKLVFENQFVEFVTEVPENYNLYGLGETIHALRLGNNYTRTIYAADAGDPIDL